MIIGFHLLLDLRELHQLVGALIGVERIERFLIFQLRRQQLQERGELLAISVLSSAFDTFAPVAVEAGLIVVMLGPQTRISRPPPCPARRL